MAYAIRPNVGYDTDTWKNIKYPYIEVEYPADTNIQTGSYNSAILRGGVQLAMREADVPETEIAKYISETETVNFDTFDDITNCWVFMVDDINGND